MLLEFLNHPFKCLKFLITETETENVIKVKRLDKKKKHSIQKECHYVPYLGNIKT